VQDPGRHSGTDGYKSKGQGVEDLEMHVCQSVWERSDAKTSTRAQSLRQGAQGDNKVQVILSSEKLLLAVF